MYSSFSINMSVRRLKVERMQRRHVEWVRWKQRCKAEREYGSESSEADTNKEHDILNGDDDVTSE